MGAKYYAIELDQVGTSTMELTQDAILADCVELQMIVPQSKALFPR